MGLVVVIGALGGILVAFLGGINYHGLKTKPLLTKVVIPPLIGMIIAGCLVRNFMGPVMLPFNNKWGSMVRSICFCVLLMRAGLKIEFHTQSYILALVAIVPQQVEAVTVALLTRLLLSVPWPVCFALGYLIACVSPSVIVPSLMSLIDRGYGRKKGIPLTMVTAGIFEDILGIIIFGIFAEISYTQGLEEKGVISDSSSAGILTSVMKVLLEVVAGFVVGALLGLSGIILNKISNADLRIWIKFVWSVIMALAFPIVTKYLDLPEAKYVGMLFFGYFSYRVWEEDKPIDLLTTLWFYIQPFLFATVGSTIIFSQLNPQYLDYALIIVLGGLIPRIIAIFLVTYSPEKYTNVTT